MKKILILLLLVLLSATTICDGAIGIQTAINHPVCTLQLYNQENKSTWLFSGEYRYMRETWLEYIFTEFEVEFSIYKLWRIKDTYMLGVGIHSLWQYDNTLGEDKKIYGFGFGTQIRYQYNISDTFGLYAHTKLPIKVYKDYTYGNLKIISSFEHQIGFVYYIKR